MSGGPTLGARVKSGRAIAVILEGSPSAPRAVARRELLLSDPATPATRQPHHATTGQAQTDRREIDRLLAIVERCASRAVEDLLASTSVRSAALVVGSLVDPETIGNQHMRAHAHEGRLFRMVLEQAIKARGIPCIAIVEKQLIAAAEGAGIAAATRTRMLDAFGKALGRPWTADEKAAALAAWIALRR